MFVWAMLPNTHNLSITFEFTLNFKRFAYLLPICYNEFAIRISMELGGQVIDWECDWREGGQ